MSWWKTVLTMEVFCKMIWLFYVLGLCLYFPVSDWKEQHLQQPQPNEKWLTSMHLISVLFVAMCLLFLSILSLLPPSTPSCIFWHILWIQYLFSIPSSSIILWQQYFQAVWHCFWVAISDPVLTTFVDYPCPLFLSWFIGLTGCNLCSCLY